MWSNPSLEQSVMQPWQDRLDKTLTKLRERNCRITPQRVAILKVFLGSADHPSVEQVYAQVRINFPTTSLATVYKTVHLLKDIGEILEIGTVDGRNRYDGNRPCPHPHLICTECKSIIDPKLSLLPKLKAEAETTSGFRITSHQLDFYGICPACQKK
jgi:Fur family peroxide stress response transcriptional regulator